MCVYFVCYYYHLYREENTKIILTVVNSGSIFIILFCTNLRQSEMVHLWLIPQNVLEQTANSSALFVWLHSDNITFTIYLQQSTNLTLLFYLTPCKSACHSHRVENCMFILTRLGEILSLCARWDLSQTQVHYIYFRKNRIKWKSIWPKHHQTLPTPLNLKYNEQFFLTTTKDIQFWMRHFSLSRKFERLQLYIFLHLTHKQVMKLLTVYMSQRKAWTITEICKCEINRSDTHFVPQSILFGSYPPSLWQSTRLFRQSKPKRSFQTEMNDHACDKKLPITCYTV